MGMTLEQAKDRLRRMIQEASAALFQESDLYEFISDAQQEFCADTDCLCGLTTFDISDGVLEHTLPTGTQRIFELWWVDGDSYWLLEQADDVESTMIWGEKQRKEGKPTRYIRRTFDKIQLNPLPAADKTCQIYRSYEPAAISLSADTFSVRDSWVRKCVLSLAAQRAFERSGEMEKAESYKRDYFYNLQEVKKQVDRWNVRSKPASQFQPQWNRASKMEHPLYDVLT